MVCLSCLHYLLPDKRDSVIIDRLRHAKTFKSLMIRNSKISQPINTVLSEPLSLAQLLWTMYFTHKLLSQTLDTNLKSILRLMTLYYRSVRLLLLHEINHYLLVYFIYLYERSISNTIWQWKYRRQGHVLWDMMSYYRVGQKNRTVFRSL